MTADRIDCGDCPNLGGCVSGHCIRAREISGAEFERGETARLRLTVDDAARFFPISPVPVPAGSSPLDVSGIDAFSFGIDLAKGSDRSASWGPYQTAGKVVTTEPAERPRSAPAETGSPETSAARSPHGGPDSSAGEPNLLEEIERTFAALADRRAERWLLLGPDGRVWTGPDPMILAAKATCNPPEAPPLPVEPKDYVSCAICRRFAAPGEGCQSQNPHDRDRIGCAGRNT